ncbi:MAG: M14-type cytosolic carboxypeptidase, partial [Chitinophagaceae bacterium]
MKKVKYSIAFLFSIISCTVLTSFSQEAKIKFVANTFENASPFNWEIDSNGVVIIELIYDHERSSVNRANQHWHFQVQAAAGSDLTFILKNFDNIWNGIKSEPISDRTPCFISQDGKNWTSIKTELLGDNTLMLKIHMEGEQLFVASLEPYRISDLQKLVAEIKNNPAVGISYIGKTAEGRPLEIIRVGNSTTPFRVFLRARA